MPSETARQLIAELHREIPDRLLNDGTSIDESVIVDAYGSTDEKQIARQGDETSVHSWKELIGHPKLLPGLNSGLGGYNFMNESGKQFYIAAALATLLEQDEPDYNQCFKLAFQFEHSEPDFSLSQYAVILKCMEYFIPFADGGDGPVSTCCLFLRGKLAEWSPEFRT